MRFQRLRKVLRWTLRAILALAVLLILFIAEENIRGRIMLSRYKVDLRAKGEKLTLEELGIPRTSQDANKSSALISACTGLTKWQGKLPFLLGLLSHPRLSGQGKRVVLQMEDNLGIDDSSTGWRYNSSLGRSAWVTPAVCDWEDLHNAVAGARDDLNIVRAELREPNLSLTNISHHELAVWTLPTWFVAATLDDLKHERLDEALENLKAIGDFARLFDDPHVIRTGKDITWEALQNSGWTPDRLAQLQQTWDRPTPRSNWVQNAELSRAWALKSFEDSYQWPTLNQILLGFRYDGVKDTAMDLLWLAAWAKQDEARLLANEQCEVEGVRVAAESSSWQAGQLYFTGIQRDYDINNVRTFYDRLRFRESGLYWVWAGIFEAETERQMLITAIALERYRLQNGEVPPDAASLVPNFVRQVPTDYMDGKPLRYHATGVTSFVLYSVGRYFIDVKGGERDLVWPQPASER